MLIDQLSIFVENRHGALATVTDALYRYGIDIRAIAVFDTTEFGIVRIVVDKPEEALKHLKAEGKLVQYGVRRWAYYALGESSAV